MITETIEIHREIDLRLDTPRSIHLEILHTYLFREHLILATHFLYNLGHLLNFQTFEVE